MAISGGLNLGDVTANFKANTMDFEKGVKGMISKLDNASKKMSSMGRSMTMGFTLPIVAGVGASIKELADFESKMSDISTLIAGDSTQAVGDFTAGINEMMKRVPKSADELGESAYSIVSAGINNTSEALAVLEESARLAVGGLGTTAEATDLMTSAINTFASEGLDATQISDILFKTVKNGKTTVAELSQSFGASAPVIAEAGVTLADFQAATAALTTTGLPASQAQMGLRQAIIALTKPTGDMEKLFVSLGMNGRELIQTEANLADVFSVLKKEADKQNISWEKSIGSVEALNATTGIMDTTVDAYQNTLGDMLDGTNSLNGAVEKQNQTTAAQFQLMKNQLNVAMREFAVEIMPLVRKAIEVITDKVGKLTEWWSNLDSKHKNIILGLGGIVAITGPVLWALGTLAGAVVKIISLGKILLPVIKTIGLAIGGLSLPVLALIAIFGTLAYIVISKWDLIKMGIEELKDQFRSIPGAIKSALSSVSSAITKPFKDAKEKVSRIAGDIKKNLNRINPFTRESPSLVDNVKKGVGIIADEYSSLRNLQIPKASMIAPIQTQTNQSNQNITINVDKVGDMNDIQSIGQELGFRASLNPSMS